MPDSPHTATQAATMTEQVARAIREEQVRLLRDDEKAKCPDNRFYEEHVAPYALAGAAIAALQGSAALPSEAMEICDWCEGSGQGVADTVCDKCNGSGGTPTAPVQDDDATWLIEVISTYFFGEQRDRVKRIASRLSQTPDTGLIEAAQAVIDARDGLVPGYRSPSLDAALDRLATALANAAPADKTDQ